MNTGKILIGVLAGVAIGAAAGIMFAPHVGSTTRRRLSQKGVDYFEGLKKTLNNMVDDMADKLSPVKDGAEELFEKGKKKADSARQTVKGNGHGHHVAS